MNPSRPRIMVSAGEASGDIHAAHALQALSNQGVEFDCFGMGADHLKSAGMELTLDCRELAQQPDLLIIVDYPDFNLKLAETAKELGIPVLFYISPQIWAWRKKRIHRIGSLVSHMAVLFPFEVDYHWITNWLPYYRGVATVS